MLTTVACEVQSCKAEPSIGSVDGLVLRERCMTALSDGGAHFQHSALLCGEDERNGRPSPASCHRPLLLPCPYNVATVSRLFAMI
eukprot:779494-Amphidinium_carterae.1